MLVNIKVTGGLNIESGQIDPKATWGCNKKRWIRWHWYVLATESVPSESGGPTNCRTQELDCCPRPSPATRQPFKNISSSLFLPKRADSLGPITQQALCCALGRLPAATEPHRMNVDLLRVNHTCAHMHTHTHTHTHTEAMEAVGKKNGVRHIHKNNNLNPMSPAGMWATVT